MLLWCLAPLAICLLLLPCEKLHTQTPIDRATSSSFTCCCSRLLNTKETVTIVQPIVSFVQDLKKNPLDFLFDVIKAWCETCWKNPLSNNGDFRNLFVKISQLCCFLSPKFFIWVALDFYFLFCQVMKMQPKDNTDHVPCYSSFLTLYMYIEFLFVVWGNRIGIFLALDLFVAQRILKHTMLWHPKQWLSWFGCHSIVMLFSGSWSCDQASQQHTVANPRLPWHIQSQLMIGWLVEKQRGFRV
jgi:hypothetical protein